MGREADMGRQIVEMAVMMALDIAGYPGGEEESIGNAICDAIEDAPDIDDHNAILADARKRFAEDDHDARGE